MNALLLAELATELDTLEEDRSAIAYALRREAEALRGSRPLHLDAVADATEQFCVRTQALQRRLSAVTESAAPPSVEAAALSLSALRSQLEHARAAMPARQLLRTIAALQGPIDEAARRQLQLAGADLEERLHSPQGLETDLDAHPLSALFRLVVRSGGMSDDEWNRDYELVRTALGSQIAAAAGRGRLSVGDGGTSDHSSRIST